MITAYADDADCEFLDRHTVRFVRPLPYAVERVWAAVTTPDQIARWFIGPARVDLRRGGEYRFGLHFAGTVQACDAPRLIEFENWRIELSSTGSGCELSFTAWVPAGFTFSEVDSNGPGGPQPFGPGTWYPGTLAGYHGMLRDLRRTLADGLNHGYPGGSYDQPSNDEADDVARTAALMAAYREIELASPVLAESVMEDPVYSSPPPSVLLRAVDGKTDAEIHAFADEFGGYPTLCFTVLEGFASQVAPFRMAPPDMECNVGFELDAVGAWSMELANGVCELRVGTANAHASVKMSAPNYLRVVSGVLSLDDAVAARLATIDGVEGEVRALIELAQGRQGPYFRSP